LRINGLNLELKQALFYQFSQYGEILDIIAKKNIKMRGQAFIIYKDINAATKAVNESQRFMFFGKPMVVLCLLYFKSIRISILQRQSQTLLPRWKAHTFPLIDPN